MSSSLVNLTKEIEKIKSWSWPRYSGKVTQVVGLLIESLGPQSGPPICLGELCYVFGKQDIPIICQVVGFKDQKILLMPLSDMAGIYPGAEVFPTGETHRVAVSSSLCGRILDGLGRPIDGKGALVQDHYYPVMGQPPESLVRRRITDIMPTGIRSIDAFLTLGKGQRVGVFSEAGVGKSTLLAMMVKNSKADINVIALIGERGREVREFIEKDLGKEGLEKSIIIVSTSDQMAPLRCKGANVATAIAEYFRDQGKHVLLIMDSMTRYAMALREIGLSVGEPAALSGYPPSVFANLPILLERAGNSSKGSITGIYAVLEEQKKEDPISEHLRALLDGHIQLSRKLARGHNFPAIDILDSLSRVMGDIVEKNHHQKAGFIRDLLQAYAEAEELIEVGAYVKGSNPKVEKVLENMSKIQNFLRQETHQMTSFEQMISALHKLL